MEKRQLFCFRDIWQMSGMLIRSQTYQYRVCEWNKKAENQSCNPQSSPKNDVTHTSCIYTQYNSKQHKSTTLPKWNGLQCAHRVITTSNMCMSGRSYPPGLWAGWTDPPPALPWLLALLYNSCHPATPILMKDRLWLVRNWRCQTGLFGHCECPNRQKDR